MDALEPWHLIIVAIAALVLFFGWKQLPEMSRSLGRSLRIFKTEIKALDDTRDQLAATAADTRGHLAATAADTRGHLAATVADFNAPLQTKENPSNVA
jgi:sec-independent protein translocase protein TatA